MATATQPNTTAGSAGTKRRLKIWFFIVALFMTWGVFKFIAQIGDQHEANRNLADVQHKIDAATKQMSDLKLQVDRLNDDEYIGQMASKELGMLKKGEKQIQPVR